MNRGKCQICGRRRPLKKSGGMVHHHVKGIPCRGKDHPPLEVDDRALEAEAAHYRAIEAKHRAAIKELVARRANWIDPAISAAASQAWYSAYLMERRLARHRAWPERYRKQMERDGMAMPPPAYLLERTS